MAVYRWNAAEEKLIDEVIALEKLVERLPRLKDFYEGIHEMRSIQSEIDTLGTFVQRTGFTPGKNFQRVATIPYSVAAALVEIDPELLKDKSRFYRWLSQHPEYDTRTTIK